MSLTRSPAHAVETLADEIRVRIELPEVAKVSEVELDIGAERLQLAVTGKYKLDLQLPHTVKDEEAGAKFDKKARVLTVTLPLASPAPAAAEAEAAAKAKAQAEAAAVKAAAEAKAQADAEAKARAEKAAAEKAAAEKAAAAKAAAEKAAAEKAAAAKSAAAKAATEKAAAEKAAAEKAVAEKAAEQARAKDIAAKVAAAKEAKLKEKQAAASAAAGSAASASSSAAAVPVEWRQNQENMALLLQVEGIDNDSVNADFAPHRFAITFRNEAGAEHSVTLNLAGEISPDGWCAPTPLAQRPRALPLPRTDTSLPFHQSTHLASRLRAWPSSRLTALTSRSRLLRHAATSTSPTGT